MRNTNNNTMSTLQLLRSVLLALTVGFFRITNASAMQQQHTNRRNLAAMTNQAFGSMGSSPLGPTVTMLPPENENEATLNILPPPQSSDCTTHHKPYSITADQVLRHIGNNVTLPSDAITVVGADYNTVTLDIIIASTLFDAAAAAVFVQYEDTKHYSTNCDLLSQPSMQRTAICWEGYATLAIFVYYGNINLDDCQGCVAPTDIEEDDVSAYYLEIPCTPNCMDDDFDPNLPVNDDDDFDPNLPLATSVPTTEDLPVIAVAPEIPLPVAPMEEDCSSQHYITQNDVLEQAGGIDLPQNAIQLLNADQDTVTVQITQAWLSSDNNNNAHLFVNYQNPHNAICEGFESIGEDASVTITAQCFDGIAQIGLFVYTDDTVDMEECQGCSVGEDVLAYSFEVPCQPLCELSSPTAPDLPVIVATETPTVSPVASPLPIETLPVDPQEEPDCSSNDNNVVYMTDAAVVQRAGDPLPIPDQAIRVLDTSDEVITVEFSQVFSTLDSISMFVNYDKNFRNVCDDHLRMRPNMSTIKSIQCFNGYAQMGVFLYLDVSLDMEECKGCHPPEQDDENVAAYYFEWECKPSLCDYEQQQQPQEIVVSPQEIATDAPQPPVEEQPMCQLEDEDITCTSDCECGSLHGMDQCVCEEYEDEEGRTLIEEETDEDDSEDDEDIKQDERQLKKKKKRRRRKKKNSVKASSSKSKSNSKSASKDDEPVAPQLVTLAEEEPCCECECFPKPCSCSCRCLGQLYTMELTDENGGRALEEKESMEVYDDESDDEEWEEEDDNTEVEPAQGSVRGGNSAKQRDLKKKKRRRRKKNRKKKKNGAPATNAPQPVVALPNETIATATAAPPNKDNKPWDVHEWWTCENKDALCAAKTMPQKKRTCKKGTTGVCKGKANGLVPDFMRL